MEFRNVVVGKEIYGEELQYDPIGVINYDFLAKRNSSHKSLNFDKRSLSYELSGSG